MKKVNFNEWLKIERIIPLVTAMSAFVADLLGILGIIKLTIGEGIFLFVLAMLASDALVERLGILGRIESKVEKELARAVHGPPSAKDVFHKGLRPFDEPILQSAKNVSISGISLLNLAVHYGKLLEEMANRGCNIRIMFMKAQTPGIADPKPASVHQQIETMQNILNSIVHSSSNIEIRYYDYSPPHGLVIVDGNTPSGYLIVTYYPYKCSTGDRPQLLLHHLDNDPWYEFYKSQFDLMWFDATPWNGVS